MFTLHYSPYLLHAKIYIFRPETWNEHNQGKVITGSSNLSDSGLGGFDGSNYEFNVILESFDDVAFATKVITCLCTNVITRARVVNRGSPVKLKHRIPRNANMA